MKSVKETASKGHCQLNLPIKDMCYDIKYLNSLYEYHQSNIPMNVNWYQSNGLGGDFFLKIKFILAHFWFIMAAIFSSQSIWLEQIK